MEHTYLFCKSRLCILRANDEKGMTPDVISRAVSFLVLAGSETTATLLSGATFHLLKNPAILKALRKEVAGAFLPESDINILSVMHLTYMNAVLDESLRIYTPTPTLFPRQTPEGGAEICGSYVPAGISVGVNHWAIYRDERSFLHADFFISERWLGDPRFDGDNKKAFQPFSAGPRNCLGKNGGNPSGGVPIINCITVMTGWESTGAFFASIQNPPYQEYWRGNFPPTP